MASCRAVLLIFLLQSAVTALVTAQQSNKTSPWQTLSGAEPIVIARGGFSGLFPDSSIVAYQFALQVGLPNTVLWCDVQLTKDAIGICLPNLLLDNITTIAGPGTKKYSVNGVAMSGHFSVDYTFNDTRNFYLTQALDYRSRRYDKNMYPILSIENLIQQIQPSGLWLNIQHDAFFTQHNLSMRSHVRSVSKRVAIDYLSSPEVNFLRRMLKPFNRTKTKLIFRFLEANITEPFTNKTYGSLLGNLTFVKTFSSGILVPKNYIWPVTSTQYLLPHTSIVTDAHKAGLEVFASDFANDVPFSYNYSYDPVAEYLSFVDNGNFSVDGVLSDFPITPSEAIGCFSHISQNSSVQAKPSIISHNGASGVYPDCTDLAYNQAVEDGADYIDCSVQMTSDGIPICLSSINLFDSTTVANSPFSELAITVPEIQKSLGIFTFNLTWNDIQSLRPTITNPEREFNLSRNPAYINAGKLLSLDEFLTFAKSKSLAGILISIENAAYLATEKGMSVTDVVIDALDKSGYINQTTKEVIIQSTDKAVLTRFKEKTSYSCMYMVDKEIRGADDSAIENIKSFSRYVAISKDSVFPETNKFLTAPTEIAWDFFSDPTVEINSYVMGADIDGVITDFPGTSAAYRKNKCLTMGNNTPDYMLPAQPGSLMTLIQPVALPPAEAPAPILRDGDVAEPPLPPVLRQDPNSGGSPPPSNTQSPSSSDPRFDTSICLSSLAMLLTSLLLI
ncbi:glycerophosphodiester phosphodiesterase [Ranunculus cassubicifolius]